MIDKILTHSLQGWVPTAFALAQTIFLLFCGEILQFFPAKLVLVWSVTIFETGSLICGVAQNVNQLIVGRTIRALEQLACVRHLAELSSLPYNGNQTVVSVIQIVA